jgi:hypothetical protein
MLVVPLDVACRFINIKTLEMNSYRNDNHVKKTHEGAGNLEDELYSDLENVEEVGH